MKIRHIFTGLLILCAGCASFEVRPIENNYGSAGESYEKGVRFYRPAPHIWITKAQSSEKVDVTSVQQKESEDEKSGGDAASKDAKWPSKATGNVKTTTVTKSNTLLWAAKVVMLPDYESEYVIDWTSGAGSVNVNFTLSDGWNLTAFNSAADTKFSETLTGTLNAIATVAAAGVGALTQETQFKGPGLYRLVYDKDEKRFKLGKPVLLLK